MAGRLHAAGPVLQRSPQLPREGCGAGRVGVGGRQEIPVAAAPRGLALLHLTLFLASSSVRLGRRESCGDPVLTKAPSVPAKDIHPFSLNCSGL